MKLGEIYGELKLKAGQFQKELTTSRSLSEKQLKAIKTAFLGVTAAIAGITYAVVKVTKSLVTAYSQQEIAEKKLDAALKATGNQVGITTEEMLNMAQEMQNLTTYTDQQVISAQGLLVTFTQIGKEVFPDAIKAAMDMSTMFGQDLQQSVIQLGTALNDPIRGVGRLRRIGISFTEEQKKTIAGFMEANDIMSAQRVILDELAVEFGGVAEAAATTTEGAIKQFQNALQNIREELGERIAPVISMYARLMTKSFNIMKEHIDILLPGIKKIADNSEEASKAGAELAIITMRGAFKIRAAITRVKIVFWGLVAVLSRVMQEMFGQLKWGSLIFRKYGETIANVIDTIFKTKLGDAIRAQGDFFDTQGKEWEGYVTKATTEMEKLTSELILVNNKENEAVEELRKEYERLIEKKIEATGIPPPIPPAPPTVPEEAPGKVAKRPAWEEEEEKMARYMERYREALISGDEALIKLYEDEQKVRKEFVDLSTAASQFGTLMSNAFTDAEMTGEQFVKTLIKMGIQLALMQVTGPLGGFLGTFFGGMFEKGGFVFTPPFFKGAQEGMFVTNRQIITPAGVPAGEKTKAEVIAPFDKFVDVIDKMKSKVEVYEPGPLTRILQFTEFSQEELDLIETELFEKVLERLEERE